MAESKPKARAKAKPKAKAKAAAKRKATATRKTTATKAKAAGGAKRNATPTRKATATKAKAAGGAKPAATAQGGSAKADTAQGRGAIDRTTDLSRDLLRSVEDGQRNAIDAVRKFVDSVDRALPRGQRSDGPPKEIIDSALEMADRLVQSQHDFLHRAIENAGNTLRESGWRR